MREKLKFLLITAILFSIFLACTGQPGFAQEFNYGEALQKAILFYEFQRSGELPEEGLRTNWRGDSAVDDGSDVDLDLSGGWYDAGDHNKFNLPQAYTLQTLAWAAYEYPEALEDSDQLKYLLAEIRWAADYLMRCHPEPDVFYYQVGDPSIDHSWWAPAEVIGTYTERPSYELNNGNPGSAVTGETAAAFATCALVFEERDPEYAEELLEHAEELYDFADSTRSDSGYTAADGYYTSESGYWDELVWAAAWLYRATGNEDYLEKAEEGTENWSTEQQSDMLAYSWGHCWDDVQFGSYLVLAQITGDEKYIEAIENHLDFWTTGVETDSGDEERIDYTPDGMAWLFQWGSLRHSTTTAFLAAIYADWEDADPERAEIYGDFAREQIDFALGSSGRSYVVGFGEDPPEHPHHRTAHSSWCRDEEVPEEHRHTLYGALVGGPDEDGDYEDDISDYQLNEVAIDYNAGFVGALAAMYDEYGGDPIEGFEAIEEPTNEEVYAETGVNTSDADHIGIKALFYNKTGWPARVIDDMSFRYFMDLSEVYENDYTADDLEVEIGYDDFDASISGPHAWDEDEHIYYVEVDCSGTPFAPAGEGEYVKEVQFRINAPAHTSFWDNSNDYSYEGVSESDMTRNENLPMYEDGELTFGQEPDGDGDGGSEGKTGDINDDGEVDSQDMVILVNYQLGQVDELPVDEEVADLNGDGEVDSMDVAEIIKYILGS
ncbi:MAG: glycoside hydrolase family 9 protein [Halanaerobiaceae bacterium]